MIGEENSTNYMIECVLLDWDGCLANTLELWIRAWKATFADFGVEVNRDEVIEKAFGDWGYAEKKGVEDMEAFVKTIYGYVNRDMPMVELNEGVLSTVKKLQQRGKKLAIVTSSRVSSIMPAVVHNKLDRWISVVLGEEDVEKLKPDPEIIYLAQEQLKCKYRVGLIVGDNQTDVLAGKAAKIETCLYLPLMNRRVYDKELLLASEPDYVIEKFDEVLGLVG